MSADDQIAEAVAVDIAGRRHREAAEAIGRFAIDLKAVAAVQAGKVDVCRKSGRLAEHHVSRARGKTVWVCARGADDEIGKAVAVDIAGGRNPKAAGVACGLAADAKPRAAIETRKFQIGAETRGLAKDHIGRSGIRTIRVGLRSADCEVGKSVAIDVTGRRDRKAADIARRDAVNLKAVCAIEAGKSERRAEARGFPEYDVGGAGREAVGACAAGADDEVGESVAVEVSGGGHCDAAVVAGGLAGNLETSATVKTRKIDNRRKLRHAYPPTHATRVSGCQQPERKNAGY